MNAKKEMEEGFKKETELDQLAKDAMEFVNNSPRARMEKEVFMVEVLPGLIGEHGTGTARAFYANFAGSPYSEIDLIENGEVVDVVPPLLASVDTNNTTEIPMHNMALQSENMNTRPSGERERYNTAMTQRIGNATVFDQETNQEKWEKFLIRNKVIPETNVSKDNQDDEQSTGDYLDYD